MTDKQRVAPIHAWRFEDDVITDVDELTDTGKWRKQFELLERIAAKADQAAADAKAARDAEEQSVKELRQMLNEWRQEQMSFWRGVKHAVSGAIGVFWKEFNKLFDNDAKR